MNATRAANAKDPESGTWLSRYVRPTLNAIRDLRFAPGLAGSRTLGAWEKVQKHLAHGATFDYIAAR